MPLPTPRATARTAVGPWSRRRRRLARRWLAAGLVAAAGGAAVATLAPAAPATSPALVAVRDLPVGAVLGPGDVREVQRPGETLPDGLLDRARLTGAVLAGPVRRGEVLTDARAADASVLTGQPAGTLAVTVDVGDPAVLAGLGPGVHVDVLARTEDPLTGAATGAERIATDVVVLRVPPAPTATGLLGGTPGSSATSVLVAVEPATATRVTAAAGRTVVAVRGA
ncbi:Flp pilus assembly protein CpaB [Kineococcus radiotolerans]|uniref:Flp pilus assembly protein CpaB n=1 Tax=Kineococcus radiotolerans TaxID=131568 RepID=A0A7W4TN79_KINRA|nr:SAF domain-containing protein [Kineococcus radiotolerans]MBB2902024.1 Flp pilus assembly protein CpaB [Kineococcus radiotolerans]